MYQCKILTPQGEMVSQQLAENNGAVVADVVVCRLQRRQRRRTVKGLFRKEEKSKNTEWMINRNEDLAISMATASRLIPSLNIGNRHNQSRYHLT